MKNIFTVLLIFSQFYFISCQPKTDPQVENSYKIISKYEILFDKPPQKVPMPYSVDAPILGNGDMAVTIGRTAEKIEFWLSKNDFWRLNSVNGEAYFSGVGHLDIEFPGLEKANFFVKQNLYDAQTEVVLNNADQGLKMRCFVAASTNLFIIELEAEKKVVSGKISIHSIQGGQSNSLQGKSGKIFWMARKFETNVEIPTAVAVAYKISHSDKPEFRIEPGDKVQIYIGLQSRFKSDNYIEDVINLVDRVDIKKIETAHQEWWQNYWAQSYIHICDSLIERSYYQSLYTMGSCSRDPDFPPSIFGPWVTVNSPWWWGDYHLNYNHLAPFYGLYSSNRLVQALPYVAPILDFHKRGRYYSKKVCGIDGVLFPVGIGPKGIETTRKSPTEKRKSHLDAYEDEGMFWGHKPTPLAEVVVSASRYQLHNQANPSTTTLSAGDLKLVPNVGGDPLRVVARLPGVAAGDLTARPNIRGGEYNETLIRFDDLRLIDPFHLRDFQAVFSAINPALVDSIDIYTGAFPVAYGNRMSSVIDVSTQSVAAVPRRELSVSFFNASLLLSGATDTGATEWVASLRRGNLDLVLEVVDPARGNPRYVDGFARIRHHFTDSFSLSASVLVSDDRIQISDNDAEEQARADARDLYFWLRADWQPSDQLRGHLLLSQSNLDSLRLGIADQPGIAAGSLRDERDIRVSSLLTEWEWQPAEQILLQLGGELRQERASFDYQDAG